MVDKGKGIADDSSSAKRKRDGDEKSGHRKRKNMSVLQFFEDSAFEIEESGSSDDDDFINDVFLEDDFGPDLEVKTEPKTPNLPFFPKEEDLDEEELDRVMEARYQPGANFVKYAEDRTEPARPDERDTSMPFVMDPTIWKVKCTAGRERHSAFCLMQKYVDLKSLGTKLQIVSAFAVEHVKGFIYIEAERQCDINEACKGLCNIYPSRVASVPMSDVPNLFSVRSKYSGVSVNTWARVKSGKYKGDLAQVVHVDEAKRKATVKLVPRLDLQAVAEKFGGGVTSKKTTMPAPRLIASSELEAYRPLVQYRRDRDTGDMYEVFDGMTLKDGYLFKKVPLDSLSFWDVRPSEAELIKFTPARKEESNDVEWLTGLFGEQKKKKPTIKNDKAGGKGEGSSSADVEDGFEVPDLVFHGRKAFGIVIGREKDDRVKVLEEGSKQPVVVAVEARLLKKAAFDKKFNALDQHKKIISMNDTVRVLEGPLEDKKGIVKQIYKGVVFLLDENETENCGYFCAKAQICEKMEFSGDHLKGKGGKSDASGFDDFPSSPKSPLSPNKPWEARENSRKFDQEEKEGCSVGQSMRIRVGPLKGYMCRVMAIRYSDITVKLDSQHKILTVKAEHLAEVRGKTSAATMGDGQDSTKPFELLGDQGTSQGWMDGGVATETGGWNTAGPSTERSSWAPFPAAGSSLQPDSASADPFNTGDNEANKDAGGSAWETRTTQGQSSAWGAAASEKKDSGWGAGSSGVKNDDAGWGAAKPKDDTTGGTSAWGNAGATKTDENKSAWNSAATPSAETGGWGAVKKDGEDSKGWGKTEAASADGGSWGKPSGGGSSWGADQKKDDSGTGGWGKAPSADKEAEVATGWGKAPSATGGDSGKWGSAADKETEGATGWGSNKGGGSSWSKPDQDGGGSSWSKPDGGSTWGQASGGGGSSWGNQDGGGRGGSQGGRGSGGNTCFKCGESGHMSRECPKGGGGGGGNACFKCGESGHMSRECPQGGGGGGGGGKSCFKCGESGHMSRECPQGGGGGGGGGRSCYKCGESGHMSRECPQGGGGGGGGRSCYKCGESGHMSRECPQGGGGGGDRSCYKCGESGHMSRECPQGGGGGGGDRSCYKCGESGHMSRECPQGGGGGGGGGKSCFKCGESGHMSRECPQGGGGGGGGGGGKSCFKCGESGHMSRECPQGGGGGGGGGGKSCFKCGESGHMSRECPQGGGGGGGGGGDRSCYKCGESGHMARDCSQGGGGGGRGGGGSYGGGGGWGTGGGGGWGSDKKESGQSSGWGSGGGGGWGSDKKENEQPGGNQSGGGGGWGSSKASDDDNGGGGGWGASKGGGSWGGSGSGGDGGKKGGWGS